MPIKFYRVYIDNRRRYSLLAWIHHPQPTYRMGPDETVIYTVEMPK